jgi:hypothetical protein
VLLVDHSTHTDFGAGASIYPTSLALWSDRAEVWPEVECDLMKMSRICRCRPVDHWVLARGIDCFLIATPDHADASGFFVRISLRANPDDWVVIDGVPIGGCTRPSIEFVVASCLMTA